MPNYGDVALKLTADWSRAQYENQEFLLTTVGHENGVADARLIKDPDAEHQFYWADPKDPKDISTAQMRGYVYVQKETWEKHPILWGDWDAQGRVNLGGLNLMARPKSRWLDDEARRSRMSERVRKDSDAEVAKAPDGLIATDAEGLRPTTRRARTGMKI